MKSCFVNEEGCKKPKKCQLYFKITKTILFVREFISKIPSLHNNLIILREILY